MVLATSTRLDWRRLFKIESRVMRESHVFIAFALVLATSITPAPAESALGSANREPLRKFMASLAPPLARARLVEADVPTVACPQDGQAEPLDPPVLPKSARVPEGTATSLAFYSAYEGVRAGVLAPRGWDCFGTYGSSGTTLYVVPHPVGGPILDRFDKVKEGPAVIKRFADGDTSGHYELAKISARIFPRARDLVERIREVGVDHDYAFTPWPADRLDYLTDFAVGYVTPAEAHGLGSAIGLPPTREPISGLVFLMSNKEKIPYLEELAVRLERSDQRLYAAIAVARIASMESLIKVAATLSPRFYEELGRADGPAAADAIVPEKRTRGPLSAQAITQFYSRLAEPLHLVSVAQLDPRTVFAQYRYRTAGGQVCDGEAQVTVRAAGDEFLIERVRALKNC
jgi:hypothetical protein